MRKNPRFADCIDGEFAKLKPDGDKELEALGDVVPPPRRSTIGSLAMDEGRAGMADSQETYSWGDLSLEVRCMSE